MASPSICYKAKCFGCKNLFEKSSILRCLHSICSKCVESLCKASELKCPICGVVSNMNEIVCDYSMPIWLNIYMKSNLKAFNSFYYSFSFLSLPKRKGIRMNKIKCSSTKPYRSIVSHQHNRV